MNIKYHKNFVKNYKRRFEGNDRFKNRYRERLKLFIKDPQNPILRDHPLKGKKVKLRAFSVTGDIRVVYTSFKNTKYFLDIGTHAQVY